ncbi:methyl-accepting chemotaxis protein [Silvimonas terrae]|uniref:Methyl-accepting chemotaxis protein n=1 Tax=Silvimonas terrae TaxID=300266 RepID=A0A840RBL7_9NEIS|nr:CHASE3 domain-containing protein [Silvimonas terrae]MBB5190745.1 methyl-accepting chemotaxis protein [Silvimonas terrae]
MNANWTFGRKIAASFVISSVLLIAIGVIAFQSIDQLIDASYRVTHTHQVLEKAASLLGAMKDAETGQRGYIITGNESYLEPYQGALLEAPRLLKDLRNLTSDNDQEQKRIDLAEPLVTAKLAELKHTIDLRRAGRGDEALALIGAGTGKKYMDDLRVIVHDMDDTERGLLKQRAVESEMTSIRAKNVILYGTLVSLAFVIAVGVLLTRALNQQVGTAVGHVQSSSAELQAAANQQASGAKEQVNAMTEITTTISELVATSRQIAESAQRVAHIAEQTALAAQNGDGTVEKGQDAIAAIRRQVDLVVNHMLDLGRKSQEIGAVLDIVAELAEQTNILAINATIEASGAGEAGRRFAVVADEIRKLADRVAVSTKSIRSQIDEVRGAVNTTVMATESGAKAVEAGARQFNEVAASFRQITHLVATTTDAAREIELSTKQQASAAEQVRIAVTDVAQATRETEASTSQTLQTASQLAGLSQDLRRLIQPLSA